MNINDFTHAMKAFADGLDDIDLSHGKLLVQIRDEVIEASVTMSEGDIFVEEHGAKHRAFDWLITRVAKLPQLAGRISAHVVPEPHFVTPAGKILDRLDDQPNDEESVINDVPAAVTQLLSSRPAGTSTVLYITSDAGEGKTTAIDHMALQQAQKYKEGDTDWLLIPMRLGGRSFLTFDDIVVAELVNRFRFPFFYYNAFIELVRLGVLVPAFDGFEEVFVEGSPDEAVSSLANLVRTLRSSGSVVIAVRKAHFEYQNFRDQARLLDATSEVDVTFARISLERWDRKRFVDYAKLRRLDGPAVVYESVCKRLGTDHPLLTRAVLAKRLVDVAEQGDVGKLLDHLGTDVADYFFQFVSAILEREAAEKWIDRSGTPHRPLLTVEEHHVLLTMIAKEMWITSSDAIDGDYLGLVTELFTDALGKSAPIAQQISNRIRQHSLMATNPTHQSTFSFDHDDFKMLYWGEALARMLADGDAEELRTYLGRRRLPAVSADAAIAAMRRVHTDFMKALRALGSLTQHGPSTSYATENAGALAIRILGAASDGSGLSLRGVYFGPDSLRGRHLRNVSFVDCGFASSSLEQSELNGVIFRKCSFDQLQLVHGLRFADVRLDDCTVSRVVLDGGRTIYDPDRILDALRSVGFEVDAPESTEVVVVEEPDEYAVLAARALRTFLRARAVNERTFERRFGPQSNAFFEDVLPSMIERGILEEMEYKVRRSQRWFREVEYKGRRPQRRFRLRVSMLQVEKCLAEGGRSSLPELLEGLVDDSD